MSSTGWRSARRSIAGSMSCRPISMSGSSSTTSSDHIRAAGAYGKTPMQTFIDTLPVAKEKLMQAA